MKTENETIIKNAERIVVIGSSCAGKSTFSARLAKLLNLKYIELDALHWLPNWVEREDDEFRELVSKEIIAEKWVIDGNYSMTRDLTWPRAQLVIWLNYDFHIVMKRAIYRTFKRSLTKEELFSGNRESLKKAFFDKDSILWWVITTFHRRRKEIPLLLKQKEYSHLNIIEFRNPKDSEKIFTYFQTNRKSSHLAH